jgi:Flp pilus assembly protein TadB
MRHLSDTGKAIEEHMQRTHPGATRLEQQACAEDAAEGELELVERPPHVVAALGATFLVVAALVVALTVTAMFFIVSIVAIPMAIIVIALLGAWGFWSWEKRRREVAMGDSAAPDQRPA